MALSGKISSTDKLKLEEYLASVREVERSIERMRTDKDKAEERARDAGRPLFAMKRPQDGLPEDIRDHIRLMCDIIALGFQTDKTRVASLLLARDLSALYYPFLGVSKQHHGASHYDTEEDYQKIVRFHVSQLAYLAQRLDAMPEGESTVLDNSLSAVPVEHVVRDEARQQEGAGGHDRRPGGQAENRQSARLFRIGRRQPQVVQPVPGHHGSDGRRTRGIRRRQSSARKFLSFEWRSPDSYYQVRSTYRVSKWISFRTTLVASQGCQDPETP